MSEQDKRAERWMFLGDRIERRTKGPWDEPADYVRADDHAAALAQARREGKKEMYSVLAECIRGLRRMRRGTKTELLKLLDALYARLLPKEESRE